jgi:ATP-dependent RNA helicase DDX54/DBP10
MLQRLKKHHEEKGTRALLLSPTRELAMQTMNFVKQLGRYTNIRSVALIGGMSQQKQERQLRAKPDVIVATPGRLWALMKEVSADGMDNSSMMGCNVLVSGLR